MFVFHSDLAWLANISTEFHRMFPSLHDEPVKCRHVFEEELGVYQFGVSPAVQDEVLRLQVSVYDAFGVQVGEGFDHTGCVEPRCRIFK